MLPSLFRTVPAIIKLNAANTSMINSRENCCTEQKQRLIKTGWQNKKKKKGDMEKGMQIIFLSRWVGLDLLCDVEKELATRGLGVPVGKRTRAE